MKILQMLVCLLAFTLTGALHAQSKAYAPEDLSQLNRQDQIRVLEKQYREMSGNELPDDQLEFYLEQIESGWSFAQIRDDMAESLQPGGGSRPPIGRPPVGRPPVGRPPIGGPPIGRPPIVVEPIGGRAVLCESLRNGYRECYTGFTNPPDLVRQMAGSRCIEGSTWGHRPGMIWVSRGCRGQFIETVSEPIVFEGRTVTCESRNRRRRDCHTDFRGPVVLVEQLSRDACDEGRTWGQTRDGVWVDRGCRAIFAEAYVASDSFWPTIGASTDYNVDCASADGGRWTCAWDRSRGQPYLVQQYSVAPCVRGRTWGYEPHTGIWVSSSCRGRFSAR